jgi:hypothetical protein
MSVDNIKEIRITCDGSHYGNLDEFNEFQGNLKELSELNLNKAKLSILTHGFTVPMNCWLDGKKKLWILDGHQRTRVLRHLRDVDGYIIPKLPYNLIEAKNKQEAKKILLAIDSSYGKMTHDGLYEFINEVGFEIPIVDFKDYVNFATIDIDNFNLGFGSDNQNENESKEQSNNTEHKICPNCGTEIA